MKILKVIFGILLAGLLLSAGCSRSSAPGNPVIPDNKTGINGASKNANQSQIHLWGLYDVYIDVAAGEVNAIPNRQAMFTCNVVNFLNKKVGSLGWKINSATAGPDYVDIDIDVSLTHPFPGMPQYNGYDVRGIFMGNGSAKLKYNPDLVYPVPGKDQIMMADPVDGFGGPDGYTRWFNKPEFSTGGMPLFQYTQGANSTPGFNPDATLNPYKYFADNIGVNENLWDYLNDHSGQRGKFSSGVTNKRNYYLRFPKSKGTVFAYAVTANWGGLEPQYHPSNAPEAIACKVVDSSDLWFGNPSLFGGSIKLDVSIWDWDSKVSGGVMSDYQILIESSVLSSVYQFNTSEMTPVAGSEYYQTYHIEIPANNISGLANNNCWVIVEQTGYTYKNDFGVTNLAENDTLAALFHYDLFVSDEVPAWINVVSPNGGEQWKAGYKYDITWTSQAIPGNVLIEYSKDNFVNDVNTIVASTENDGLFQWKVPNDPSSTVKVRITDISNPSVKDTSNEYFTILEKPTLKILSPNGGEIWDVDSTQYITWESTGDIAFVRIGYSKDNFVSDVHEIVSSTENDGIFEWKIPNDPSSTVKVGIVDTAAPSIYDISDDNFTIKAEKPTITVVSPNGGEIWKVNSTHNITWTTTDVINFVRIEYSKDNFVSDIHVIANSTENDGVFEWKIPNDPSSTVRVRITDTSNSSVTDTSDSDFTIVEKPILKIIAPNGGEVLYVNSFYNITWESEGNIESVRIGYSKDNFVSDVNEIVNTTENDGLFVWQVPNDPSSTVKIGIVDTSNPSVYDLSDNYFTIKTEVVQTSEYWNQFMHDSTHSGLTGAYGPKSCNYQWTHNEGFTASPACIVEGFDGTIYYGNAAPAYPGNEGRIWAVNPDGSTKWIYDAGPDGSRTTPLGITPDNSILYAGIDESFGGGGGPFDGRLVGIDTSNGKEVWTYDAWDLRGWFLGTNFGLVLKNGDYVTLANRPNQLPGQRSMFRINQFGSIKWTKQISFNWWSAPAQGLDGTIYVNVQPFMGKARILAINPDTGATINKFEYDYDENPFSDIQTCVAVRPDGRVVFASGHTGYCLNPDLSLVWSISYPSTVDLIGPIGIGPNNEIYVHSDTALYALSASGAPLWGKLYSSDWMCPAIGADGIIYIAHNSGIDALNPLNGNPIWTYSDNPASSPIITHDGSLYVVIESKLTKFGK